MFITIQLHYNQAAARWHRQEQCGIWSTLWKGTSTAPYLNMNMNGIYFRGSSVPAPSKYNIWKTRVMKHIWWVKFRSHDRDFNWYQDASHVWLVIWHQAYHQACDLPSPCLTPWNLVYVQLQVVSALLRVMVCYLFCNTPLSESQYWLKSKEYFKMKQLSMFIYEMLAIIFRLQCVNQWQVTSANTLKSAPAWAMAWCHQATGHYLGHCRTKYLSPYSSLIIRGQQDDTDKSNVGYDRPYGKGQVQPPISTWIWMESISVPVLYQWHKNTIYEKQE